MRSDFMPSDSMLPDSDIPFYAVDAWAHRFPWLMAGITHAGIEHDPFDLRLFGDPPLSGTAERWRALLSSSGFGTIAHARQVHETRVALHDVLPRGVHVESGPADGHATSTPGTLLAVTVADCVPVYLVDPERRAVALLHAGWRGVAGGIMAKGVQALHTRFASRPAHLHVHLGPAICGTCYEVGPEVHEALGLPTPSGPMPVDVRATLVSRARALGVRERHITVSEHCTLCGMAGLFSHRGGRSERQAALLGIRP